MSRLQSSLVFRQDVAPLDVSVVMPCLNEAISLPHCIANAQRALDEIAARFGLAGEIVIADNGSTDGSRDIAESLGARVVPVAAKGYGAAIIGGAEGAFGTYLVIGDADGSYDFTDGVAMVGTLIDGADLCMGSRFQGGIAKGAMPWKNRYIGNPVLTGTLNLFFRSGIDDAHCGLRAIRRESFFALKLGGEGMEFASEMVVKASLKRLRIAQVPATLSPDLRGRPPHLRPWRDGWRHLRYLMMLSPTALYIVPSAIAATISLAILAMALVHALAPQTMPGIFGNYWQVGASALGAVAHQALILGVATHLYGVRAGYRETGPRLGRLTRFISLDTMLVAAVILVLAGTTVLAATIWSWTLRDFGATYSVLPAVGGTLLIIIGVQNVFGGFLLSVIGGNDAAFFKPPHTPSLASETLTARPIPLREQVS